MTAPPAAAGALPWPKWTYIPGDPGADPDHVTLAAAKALVPPAFRGYVPARHPALRYGLALNDLGYFWEAQEILETVWAAAPQGGRERILLRACIQIATANLRLRAQREHSALRLFGEALAELRKLTMRSASGGGDGFVDSFPTHALTTVLQARLAQASLTEADWVRLGVISRDQENV